MCKRVNLPIYFVCSVYVVNVIYKVYVVYIAIRVCNVIVVYVVYIVYTVIVVNTTIFSVNTKKDTPARVPQFYSVFKRLVLHFSYRMLSIFSHGVFQMIENAFPRDQSVFLIVT